jgi:3-ketoacyl-CoA synthase
LRRPDADADADAAVAPSSRSPPPPSLLSPPSKPNQNQKQCCTPEKHEFVSKVFLKAGINTKRTYLPAWLNPIYAETPLTDLDAAAEEAKMVLTGVVSDLLDKTGLKPTEIDILVTNCSIYCPTPSLASLLVNTFKMREDVEAYHLGGMGCATGVVGLSLVRDLLQAHPGKRAVFVSSEIVTHAFYPGLQKHALVANALFRMGGAAALLSSNPADRRTAKYQLLHAVRVHTGASDRAYECMHWGPDDKGINGMHLTKDLPSEAARALEKAVRAITPKIMTWGQYAEAATALVQKHVLGQDVPDYVPDYTRCADKFLLHAGGYAILRGIQSGLRLPAAAMMPSFASLSEFGNTSSASTWYTWAYVESCESVAKGERVLQIGVGGGMKSGVGYWRALRDIHDVHPAWAHWNGAPMTEDDLPRPISVEYRSAYDAKEAEAANGGKGDAATAARQGPACERAKAPAVPAVVPALAAEPPLAPTATARERLARVLSHTPSMDIGVAQQAQDFGLNATSSSEEAGAGRNVASGLTSRPSLRAALSIKKAAEDALAARERSAAGVRTA